MLVKKAPPLARGRAKKDTVGMKKISIVSLASLLFLFLCSAVARLTRGLFPHATAALVVGAVTLAVSGLLAWILGQRLWANILCFFISALAMGVLIRAWYILRELDNTLPVMLLVSAAAVGYLWVFFALSRLPFVQRSSGAYALLCVLYLAASVGAYLAVMLSTKTTYVSTFGYYMAIELAFIFAMSMVVSSPEGLIRNLTLSTYSVLIVALIAGAIALMVASGDADCDCDCDFVDCCDGCDCGTSDGTGKKKGNKKKGTSLTPHDLS